MFPGPMRLLDRARGAAATPRCRTGWCGRRRRCCWPTPTTSSAERLRTVDELLRRVSGPAAELLARPRGAALPRDPMEAATDYVETFDCGAAATLFLTYWTAGDTRNRGRECWRSRAYRDAGVAPPARSRPTTCRWCWSSPRPSTRRPGRRLLVEHRVPIDVLHDGADRTRIAVRGRRRSGVRDAAAGHRQRRERAQRLAQAGPPAEAVGLEPFTLTVPPRRDEGGRMT